MPYNVSDTGPAAYDLQQQGMRQEKLQNLIRLLLSQSQQKQAQSNWQTEQDLAQQKFGLQQQEGAAERPLREAQTDYYRNLSDYTKRKPEPQPRAVPAYEAKGSEIRRLYGENSPEYRRFLAGNPPAPIKPTAERLPVEYTSQKDAVNFAFTKITDKIKQNESARTALSKATGDKDQMAANSAQIAVIAARNAKLSNSLKSVGKMRMRLASGKPIPEQEISGLESIMGGESQGQQPVDQFKIGESKVVNGRTWTYIGNDKWQAK